MNSCIQQIKPTKIFLVSDFIAYFGIWISSLSIASYAFPYRISHLFPDSKELYLSIILGLGAIITLIFSLVFGRLSDTSKNKIGKRKIFILPCSIFASILLIMMPFANYLWEIILLWIFFQVSMSGVTSTMSPATTTDNIDTKYRYLTSGIATSGGCLGMLSGIGLTTLFFSFLPYKIANILSFTIPSIIFACCMSFFILFFNDSPSTQPREKIFKEIYSSFTFNPLKNRNFSLILFCRFFNLLSVAIISNYLLYYLQSFLTDDSSRIYLTLCQTLAISFAFIGGFFISKIIALFKSSKRFICFISLLCAISSILLSITNMCTQDSGLKLAMIIICALIIGFGNGSISSSTQALSTEYSPDNNYGKWLGMISISSMLPQSFGPALVPMLLLFNNNYSSLYMFTGLFHIFGFIFIIFLNSSKKNSQ